MDDGRPIDSIVLQDGASLHIRDKAEFFKDHPELNKGKRAERLPGVLRYAHFHPDASDNSVALAVAPETKNHNWAGDLREVMVAEGLIEGERFQLTETGEAAATIFDALTELSVVLNDQPERTFPPSKVAAH